MENTIRNENCFDTMKKMNDKSVDIILTSPFYNTNKKAGKNSTLENTVITDGYHYIRYDVHVDSMTNDEYCDYTINLFNEFDRVMSENGCVLYNMSYGSENTEGMIRAINDIITRTNFTMADMIVWKKSNALPNSCSPNKLTRIVEYVYVLCRKSELGTFHSNKKVTSLRKTGQKAYENITNIITAKNNDGSCPYNKATYSTDLCEQLLSIYARENSLVYDPFMGSGTTAVACVNLGHRYIGSEISENQCKWAEQRINEINTLDK